MAATQSRDNLAHSFSVAVAALHLSENELEAALTDAELRVGKLGGVIALLNAELRKLIGVRDALAAALGGAGRAEQRLRWGANVFRPEPLRDTQVTITMKAPVAKVGT